MCLPCLQCYSVAFARRRLLWSYDWCSARSVRVIIYKRFFTHLQLCLILVADWWFWFISARFINVHECISFHQQLEATLRVWINAVRLSPLLNVSGWFVTGADDVDSCWCMIHKLFIIDVYVRISVVLWGSPTYVMCTCEPAGGQRADGCLLHNCKLPGVPFTYTGGRVHQISPWASQALSLET